MKTLNTTLATLCVLGALACGDDGTGPEEDPSACTDDTGTVEVTVDAAATPTFTWSPACAVSLFLIEEDGSDVWGVDNGTGNWGDPATGNVILPPITFGTVPEGASELQPAEDLIVGRTYEVVLWRAVPESSTATCVERFGTICLMAVTEFTR